MKVGILQINPHTLWNRGGGEIHAEKTIEFLKNVGVDAFKFDINAPQDIDILHIFGSSCNLNDFSKYAKYQGIKTVITPILFPSKSYFKYQLFLKFSSFLPFKNTLILRKELVNSTDLVIANTNEEKYYLHKAYGVEIDKIYKIPTGSDIVNIDYKEFYDKYQLKDFILLVGRVTPLKQQYEVVNNLKNLNRQIVIIGQEDSSFPEYAKKLDKLCKESNNIYWIKGLPAGSSLLYSAFAASKCHVLFSKSDVAPLVNIEAIINKTLCVSKNHITVQEIMDGHAYLVKDFEELIEAIEDIYNLNIDQYNEKINKNYEFAIKKFSWLNICSTLKDIYKSLL